MPVGTDVCDHVNSNFIQHFLSLLLCDTEQRVYMQMHFVSPLRYGCLLYLHFFCFQSWRLVHSLFWCLSYYVIYIHCIVCHNYRITFLPCIYLFTFYLFLSSRVCHNCANLIFFDVSNLSSAKKSEHQTAANLCIPIVCKNVFVFLTNISNNNIPSNNCSPRLSRYFLFCI